MEKVNKYYVKIPAILVFIGLGAVYNRSLKIIELYWGVVTITSTFEQIADNIYWRTLSQKSKLTIAQILK